MRFYAFLFVDDPKYFFILTGTEKGKEFFTDSSYSDYKNFQKKTLGFSKLAFIAVIIASVIMSSSLYLLMNIIQPDLSNYQTEAAGESWLAGWTYRKEVTLSSATPMANYQVKIQLTAANFNYAQMSFPATGADLRFTGSDGSTSQNYWIESWVNGGTSTIWVKVASSGTSAIYMYYGNPFAAAGSDGANTFVVFDNFDRADNATVGVGWTETYDPSFEISGNALKMIWVSGHDNVAVAGVFSVDTYIYQARMKASATNNLSYFIIYGDAINRGIGVAFNIDSKIYALNGNLIGSYAADTYYDFIVIYHRDTRLYDVSISGVGSLSGQTPINTGITNTVSFRTGTSVSTTYVDHIFIRQYAATEPSATLGDEEFFSYFTVAGTGTMNAGASQVVTITAKTNLGNTYTGYAGDKLLTFSGASISGAGNNPTCSDKTSADINFGAAATVTFASGAATCEMKLYKVESAVITVTDGTHNANSNSLAVSVVDTISPSSFNLSSPSDGSLTSDNKPTLTWNASSDSGSGLAKYQLYIDSNLDTDNISSGATSVAPANFLSCGSHTWYVKAVDVSGNLTSSGAFNLSIACGGGLPIEAYNPPVPPPASSINPQGGFQILINDGEQETNSRTVILKFNVSSDVKRMAISEYADFASASQEEYLPTKQLVLSEGEGVKIVYAKFYTQYGVASETVSDSIILKTISAEAALETPAGSVSKLEINNPESAGAKSPLYVFTQTVQIGSHNSQVVQLQDKLKELNFFSQEVKSNGSFGLTTKQAVMKYQRSKGIYPNGIVGPRTRKALNGEDFITNKDYRFTQDLKYNDKKEDVKQLQTRLKDQNFFPYNVSSTGWFGPITAKAVNLFKGFYDLIKNEIVDENMRKVLNNGGLNRASVNE